MTRIFIFMSSFDDVNDDFVNKSTIRENENTISNDENENTISNNENEKRNRCRENMNRLIF